MIPLLTVIGTRPEAIKLAPVIKVLEDHPNFINKVCLTRQHTDLINPLLVSLGIKTDYEFEKQEGGQSLIQTAAHLLLQFETLFNNLKPALILVQGDTTTAFVAALAAYYDHIPIAHVEAGLRTGDLSSPWPEEGHRCLIAQICTYFFAPTLKAKEALLREGVRPDKIWVVGNTAIDAVRLAYKPAPKECNNKPLIIVTVHRRENHGEPLKRICMAMIKLASHFSSLQIKFFLHPNPAVREPVIELLSGIKGIDLVEPLGHQSFIELLSQCSFVITDSGGIQEEAAFLGKPVLIVRNTTERPEGIQEKTAHLVGTKPQDIFNCCKELLEDPAALAAMSKGHNAYGSGYAAKGIVSILEGQLLR